MNAEERFILVDEKTQLTLTIKDLEKAEPKNNIEKLKKQFILKGYQAMINEINKILKTNQ